MKDSGFIFSLLACKDPKGLRPTVCQHAAVFGCCSCNPVGQKSRGNRKTLLCDLFSSVSFNAVWNGSRYWRDSSSDILAGCETNSGRSAVTEGLVLFSLQHARNLSLDSARTGLGPRSHTVWINLVKSAKESDFAAPSHRYNRFWAHPLLFTVASNAAKTLCVEKWAAFVRFWVINSPGLAVPVWCLIPTVSSIN